VRIACWIPKATNTISQYVIRIAFPLPQRLSEGFSVFRCTQMACLFFFVWHRTVILLWPLLFTKRKLTVVGSWAGGGGGGKQGAGAGGGGGGGGGGRNIGSAAGSGMRVSNDVYPQLIEFM